MDIYNMTNKLGFTAEYTESISPVERNMYISYYIKEREEEEKKKKGNKGNQGISIGE